MNVLAASNEPAKSPIKVGFVLCGPITDHGWNQSHNDGRLYLEKTSGGKVQTIFAESVSEILKQGENDCSRSK